MDGIEVNGNDGALNFDVEADDPFAIPPPLDGLLLADDPGDIGGQEINPLDNVDGDNTQDSAEKKKKKRAFKPRVNLNEERLCSKKGIEALKNLCSDVHFKGKGHEESDLNKLLHRFEHWAQCLMPRWPFDNVVQKCEVLGSKSRVKSELKRIRRDEEEEVLRGEPEENEEQTGQAGATNEENSAEATSQQDVPQEESRPVELTEEQRERIRRNRVIAFEKREAKRRRLEESQTQSQLEDGQTNAAQETNEENCSSEQPGLTNVSWENTAPEETLADVVPDEIHEDTNGNQNGSMDNINDEADLNILGNNINDEAGITNILENDNHDDGGLPYILGNDSPDEANMINIPQNDSPDEADLINVPENESNVLSQNNVSAMDDSSQMSNMNNKRQHEENDDVSDEDDDILNRSAFDLNPPRPDASLSVDTNIEVNARKDEITEDHSHANNKEDNVMLENGRQETNSSNSDNATANINSSSSTTEHVDLSKEPSSPQATVTEGASVGEMDVDNPTTE